MDVPRTPARRTRRPLWTAAAVGLVVVASTGLSRVKPAAPAVDRAGIWTDTVRLGDLVRQVRAPGTLVAEGIRWVSASSQGRIEARLVEPGAAISAGTVLFRLSNPEVERQALEAERHLAGARSEYAAIQASLEAARLDQRSALAALATQLREGRRQAVAAHRLWEDDLGSRAERDRAADQVQDLETRVAVEQERLASLNRSFTAQMESKRGQIRSYEATLQFARSQVQALEVRAGTAGVVQDVSVQVGQWVQPGFTLAKVLDPGQLKAVLRVPEVQARDLGTGQRVIVDTRHGLVPGSIARIDPAVQNGTVNVEVSLAGPLPRGARPDLSVDGTIDLERLPGVLSLRRPASATPEAQATLYRVRGDEAEAVPVHLGPASADAVVVRSGLSAGDVVIVSDATAWDGAPRLRLR